MISLWLARSDWPSIWDYAAVDNSRCRLNLKSSPRKQLVNIGSRCETIAEGNSQLPCQRALRNSSAHLSPAHGTPIVISSTARFAVRVHQHGPSYAINVSPQSGCSFASQMRSQLGVIDSALSICLEGY